MSEPSAAAGKRRQQRLEAITGIVARADPALPTDVVVDAVVQVAAAPVSLARLAGYLAEHPDALTTGHSRPPKVVGALIAALVDAGSSVLVIPRCAGCDRQVELFHTRGPDERICVACWKRQHVAECVDCGRVRPVGKRTATGGARCAMCRKRASLESCGECGRLKQVARRNPDGTARCSTCLRRDTSTWADCDRCGQRRPVNARTESGRPLCPSCYRQPADECTGCGDLAVIASRAGGNAVCYRCYRHPRRECGGCGRTRRVAVRGSGGDPDLCPTCHQAPVLACGICGVLDRCRTTTDDRSPICFRCQVARRLDEILADPAGRVPAVLVPLRKAILSVDNPVTALGWLGRSPAIETLSAIAGGQRPLAHATLDAAAGSRRGRAFAVEHLRQLLVASGALPDRDRHLARVELAIEEFIEGAHPDDRQVLRTYATWRLLHRLRRKSADGRPTAGAAYRVRDQTAEASRFLVWLRDHDTSLASLSQADLDAWLAQRPRSRRLLIGFLTWAHDQRLAPKLELPWPPARDPVGLVADDQRWRVARRVLSDDTLEPRDRVAAALLLLYGQTAARITRLTRADIDDESGQVTLRLGKDHIVLPPPLDQLIQQLPERVPVGMARRLATDDQWLFPGRRPGQPMNPTTLGHRLRGLGIEPRAARNTALLQLGAELPSVVLADLLGIHIGTAERWAAAAGGRWTHYAAARLDQLHPGQPQPAGDAVARPAEKQSPHG